LDPIEARVRLAAAPVGRLATVTPSGAPHVVPVCFALVDDVIYSAVDSKPKTSTALKRLDNVAANPAAALLVDHYEDAWTALWWVRADGVARTLERDVVGDVVGDAGAERQRAIAALRAKYPQYRDHPLADAVMAIEVSRWAGWAAAAPAGPEAAPESAPGTSPAPGR
jgi:PPOX class probable F420-dependent enzyme